MICEYCKANPVKSFVHYVLLNEVIHILVLREANSLYAIKVSSPKISVFTNSWGTGITSFKNFNLLLFEFKFLAKGSYHFKGLSCPFEYYYHTLAAFTISKFFNIHLRNKGWCKKKVQNTFDYSDIYTKFFAILTNLPKNSHFKLSKELL